MEEIEKESTMDGFREQTIEELDEARERERLKKIEAAMFISAKWLTLQELVMLTDINPIMLKQLLDKLQANYAESDCAIEILSKDNLWKMDVKEEYTNLVNKMATGKAEFTKGEQETLAVIAYKQPVKQSVIIKIRGNKAYDHIHKFSQLGLVKVKKLGHTNELCLSEDFYDYFHVGNNDLLGNPEKEEKTQNSGGE
jgi:segregation and condensation protein B